MDTFDYVRPTSLGEVVALMRQYGRDASLLLGGTDLLVRMRRGDRQPQVVVDLKRVRELTGGIAEQNGYMTVGAGTVLADLIEDTRMRRHFPALLEAAATIGSVQIRNRATLVGNICNASPAADTAPALLIYGATVDIIGTGGERAVPIGSFFVGPGQTVLVEDEVVVSVNLPIPSQPVGAAFARLTRRRGVDLATVSVCCSVDHAGVTRFAFGAAGPTPILVTDDSGLLADPDTDETERQAVLQRLVNQTSPISDVRGSREYRQAMLLVLSRRVLSIAHGRLREEG